MRRTNSVQSYSDRLMLTYEPVYVNISLTDVGFSGFVSRARRLGLRDPRSLVEEILKSPIESDIYEKLSEHFVDDAFNTDMYDSDFFYLETEIVEIISSIDETLAAYVSQPERYLLDKLVYNHTAVFRKINVADYH